MQPSTKNVLWVLGLLLFTFFLDFLALKTGFPYGYFWYGKAAGPALLGVPLLTVIGFPLLFLGANAMANRAGVSKGVPFMLVVALVLFAAHLVIDPVAVYKGIWVFRNGGEYLDVPVGNFVGVLFTGSLAAFAFPNDFRSEKLVALLVLAIAVAVLFAIIHGLLAPSIIGLLLAGAIAWFDLKKHGWRS